MDESKTEYGPRKLGKKAWEKRQAEKALRSRQATMYGKRKRPARLAAAVQEAEASADTPVKDTDVNPFVRKDGSRVTISDLEKLVVKSPELLDVAIETELGHPDKPRKGAVEALIKAEGVRAGGPRKSVLELLQKVLAD